MTSEKFPSLDFYHVFYLATVAISFSESMYKANESDGMVQLSLILSMRFPENFTVNVKVNDDSSNATSKSYMYFYAF